MPSTIALILSPESKRLALRCVSSSVVRRGALVRLPQIVKERQIEFDVETDPDALYDLFGEDADSLGE